jgi:hypothetical protein
LTPDDYIQPALSVTFTTDFAGDSTRPSFTLYAHFGRTKVTAAVREILLPVVPDMTGHPTLAAIIGR